MFDLANDRPFDGKTETIVDAENMACALTRLSNDELDALQDDLDFCRFAGVPSPRILSILDRLTQLDADWKAQLRRVSAAA